MRIQSPIRFHRGFRYWLVGAALNLWILCSSAMGQGIANFNKTDAFVELGWDKNASTSTLLFNGAQTFRSGSTNLGHRYGLRGTTNIIDPRFLRIDSGFTLNFFKAHPFTDDTETFNKGRLLGYDLMSSILPEKILPITVYSNRSESIVSREFSGSSEFHVSNKGITITPRQRILPSTITYRTEQLKEFSETDAFDLGRHEKRKSFAYDGRGNWKMQDMTVHYEMSDIEDIGRSISSYQSQNTSLYHRLRFGQESTKYLTTQVNQIGRKGSTSLSLFNLNEEFNIRHSNSLGTSYNYSFTKNDSAGFQSTTHMAIVSLNHKLYESVQTNLIMSGLRNTVTAGGQQVYGSRARISYQKKLPAEGTLFMGVGGVYEVQQEQFPEAILPIFSETHNAQIGIPFRLDKSRILSETIVLSDRINGEVFLEGFDYNVRLIGEIVEVDILSSGKIRDGQNIAVDYQIRVSPFLKFASKSGGVNVGMNYQWIYPYFDIQRQVQKLLDGQEEGFLDNMRMRIMGVQLRKDSTRFRILLTNELQSQQSRILQFDAYQFGQSIYIVPVHGLNLTLNLDEILTSYQQPVRETASGTGRFTAVWTPWRSLTIEGMVSVRLWDDSLGPNEEIREYGIEVDWALGKFSVKGSYRRSDRTTDLREALESRLALRVFRRF